MKHFIKTTLLAAALVVGLNSQASAELGYIIGAATVDGVSTTACTTGLGQTVTAFGNGVDVDQVWALEQEVGSKGSGAWSKVSGYEDVFPTINGAAAVGGVTQVARYTSQEVACFRLHMTTDTAGTAQVQLVTNRDAPTAFPGESTHVRWYDDFRAGGLAITTSGVGDTPSYLAHKGGTAAAVVSVIEGEAEGTLTFSGGDAGTDADLSTGSFGLLTNGALVSDGTMAVEYRVATASITDAQFGFGLVDLISAGTEIAPFEANTNVVAEGAVTTTANAAAIFFNTDSNDAQGDFWLAGSLNGNAQGNAADEYSLGGAPVAASYSIVRIEIDKTGHAFFYIDGLLQGAEPLAAATTAVLIPYWWAGSPDDGTGTTTKLHIDYLEFWSKRPGTVS
jgi:hypothetical protein